MLVVEAIEEKSLSVNVVASWVLVLIISVSVEYCVTSVLLVVIVVGISSFVTELFETDDSIDDW